MDLKWTRDEYLNYVEMDSQTRFLLVEGERDCDLFRFLFYHTSIDIKSAANLIEAPLIPENREKVEWVADAFHNKPFRERFVGFVDREFREFEFEPAIRDQLERHHVADRLVWSRGHSAENYFFAFERLEYVLKDLVADADRRLVETFSFVVGPMIRIGCAVSLAARDVKSIKKVEHCIVEEMIEQIEAEPSVSIQAWSRKLRGHLDEAEIDLLTERFTYWQDRVESVDDRTLRWLCHGHIGFSLVWAAFRRLHQLKGRKPVQRKSTDIFRQCAHRWAEDCACNPTDYPSEVAEMLGIKL